MSYLENNNKFETPSYSPFEKGGEFLYRIPILILFFIIIQCSQILAQEDSTSSKPQKPLDTLKYKNMEEIMKENPPPPKKPKFEMQLSPKKAIIYSLIFPGLGQIYSRSYWKAPLFVGGAATCVYFYIDNNKKYSDAASQYDAAKNANPNDPYLYIYESKREFYRDNRDQSAFFFVGVYILAAIDAYVDTHLYDFNVDDKLSFNLKQDKFRGMLLCFNIKF